MGKENGALVFLGCVSFSGVFWAPGFNLPCLPFVVPPHCSSQNSRPPPPRPPHHRSSNMTRVSSTCVSWLILPSLFAIPFPTTFTCRDPTVCQGPAQVLRPPAGLPGLLQVDTDVFWSAFFVTHHRYFFVILLSVSAFCLVLMNSLYVLLKIQIVFLFHYFSGGSWSWSLLVLQRAIRPEVEKTLPIGDRKQSLYASEVWEYLRGKAIIKGK